MSTDDELRLAEVKQLEQEEADAMLRADLSALDSLWDEKLIAYSTAALFAKKHILLDYMRSGGMRLKFHKRRTLEVVLDGDKAITIGTENTELDGADAGTLLLCSYMNVWTRRPEGWKLLARYVGRVSRTPV
jgi:hypothetical protein